MKGMKRIGRWMWAALALVVSCRAEEAEPAGKAPAGRNFEAMVEKLLKDEDGELSKLAEKVLGKDGGDRLFYYPTGPALATPERYGYEYEEVTFASADGTELNGWFLPVIGEAEKVKATIVFSHGNAGALGHHLGFVTWLVSDGYNVFMYDYRGFGKSQGTVGREGMIRDVQAAFAYIVTRKDLDSGKLVSFGHSLGGAKSIAALADQRPTGLKAVITDGAFASYKDMAKTFAGNVGDNLVTNEWSARDCVAKLAPLPLLIVHGTEDEVVPFAQGEILFAKAGRGKEMMRIEGGKHTDSLARNDGEYRQKVLEWLAKVL